MRARADRTLKLCPQARERPTLMHGPRAFRRRQSCRDVFDLSQLRPSAGLRQVTGVECAMPLKKARDGLRALHGERLGMHDTRQALPCTEASCLGCAYRPSIAPGPSHRSARWTRLRLPTCDCPMPFTLLSRPRHSSNGGKAGLQAPKVPRAVLGLHGAAWADSWSTWTPPC